MEMNRLRIMIERFFNAELSVEEERELCRFLRENDVPAELRKDKEAIIALCGDDVEAELPTGAEARLEAMIDTLAGDEERYVTDERSIPKARERIFSVPRLVWRGVAAVAVLAVGYMIMDKNIHSPAVRPDQQYTAELPEEDTFDNPEDAMECFKAVMGDIKLAINTTENNTREIGDALNDALLPYKDIIRINM